ARVIGETSSGVMRKRGTPPAGAAGARVARTGHVVGRPQGRKRLTDGCHSSGARADRASERYHYDARRARAPRPALACTLPAAALPYRPDHICTAEARMEAREIMTKDPRTVTPDTGLQEVARLMQQEVVGIIPVVEAGGTSLL